MNHGRFLEGRKFKKPLVTLRAKCVNGVRRTELHGLEQNLC